MAALMMCGSPTPVGETDNNEATEALCLEASGDGTLDDVQQLVLRNKDLTGLACASKLTHLSVLSLSHNRLTTVASLTPIKTLEVLNVNFNRLTDLVQLAQCPKLQKIYASNNLITNVDGLASLKQLKTLCLFANDIERCELVLDALSRCPLTELDLDGNPLAREEGYRHHAVARLSRLEALDGEPVQDLDRELARDYRKGGATSRVATSFDWNSLPRESRLFGEACDALNDDKVAVDYLAAQVLRNPRRGVEGEHFTAEKAKSFVARLKREATAHREPKTVQDVADPYVTIRKLIQLVESLQAELKTRDPSDELLKEMELLRVENGNLYIVQGECQELRKKRFDVERLASENRELRERLSDAEAQLQAHHLAEITGTHTRSRPRTAAEVLEECEGEMDSELEELFRRNQTNLTHIKQEIAVMKGEQSTSLIDEAPTPVKAPQERDPDVDTPAVRRPVRSTVPRPGTSEGRRLKCSASSVARRPKTPSVADILRGVSGDNDDDAPQWSDAIDRRTTATVSPDRVVATKHAYLLGDGGPSPSKSGYGDGFEESKMTAL
ncbi:unnamed protein product [Pelagomonas calceolata]|uniref:U2A'/phosphoprotein 32 family A C-terminal domain-containing protein n=1 Tax=Pelagomonas calceolata TaxID=35677 RepID=A0A8J2SJJ3_9STRA|nr:unnamed protein product [Pelagomonas calceolata]